MFSQVLIYLLQQIIIAGIKLFFYHYKIIIEISQKYSKKKLQMIAKSTSL